MRAVFGPLRKQLTRLLFGMLGNQTALKYYAKCGNAVLPPTCIISFIGINSKWPQLGLFLQISNTFRKIIVVLIIVQPWWFLLLFLALKHSSK